MSGAGIDTRDNPQSLIDNIPVEDSGGLSGVREPCVVSPSHAPHTAICVQVWRCCVQCQGRASTRATTHRA